MSKPKSLNRSTKTIAMIAIFSALYAALRIIPTVPMIGTGATFHLSDILAPLYGILLGPFTGGISIIIGTFGAIAIVPNAPFFGLDFLPAFVVAVSLGLLVRRKWLPVVILNVALLLAYAANPLTSNFISTPFGTVPYLWMHILAFIVLLSPLGRKAGQWVKDVNAAPKIQRTKKYIATLAGGLIAVVVGVVLLLLALSMPEPFVTSALKTVYAAVSIAIVILAVSFMVIKLKVTKLTIGFTVLAFIGTMMQHLMGGILFEVVSGQIAGTIPLASYPGIWTAVFYVYPWERLALIIGAVVVGVPVTRALGKFIFPPEPKPVSSPSADQSIPK